MKGVNLCHTNIMENRDRDANLVVVAACSGKGKTRMLPRPLIFRDIPKLPTSVRSVCSHASFEQDKAVTIINSIHLFAQPLQFPWSQCRLTGVEKPYCNPVVRDTRAFVVNAR